MKAATLETLMMPPWPRSAIAPRAAWVSRITAMTRTSSMACSCSTSLSRNRRFRPKPALLTSELDRPVASATASSTAISWSRSVRSATSTSTSTAYVVRSSLGDRLQPLRVARHEHQVVAALGELSGELVADPSGGTGDQCGARGES